MVDFQLEMSKEKKKWWQSSTFTCSHDVLTVEDNAIDIHYGNPHRLTFILCTLTSSAPSRLPTSTHHHKVKFIDFHDLPLVGNKHVSLHTVYTAFGYIWFLGRVSSVGVVHDGLHVVPGKQTRDAVAHSLEPAVVILLDDVDDGSFHERQLVVLIFDVVVDGNHCKDERY